MCSFSPTHNTQRTHTRTQTHKAANLNHHAKFCLQCAFAALLCARRLQCAPSLASIAAACLPAVAVAVAVAAAAAAAAALIALPHLSSQPDYRQRRLLTQQLLSAPFGPKSQSACIDIAKTLQGGRKIG